MKTKTKIGMQLRKKTSPDLIATIIVSKKNSAWKKVADALSSPRSNKIGINLDEISRIAKEGEIIAIPGKVLSQGEMEKKLKIAAFGFSEMAKEKILMAKGQAITLIDEIKSNPSAKGVRIITGK